MRSLIGEADRGKFIKLQHAQEAAKNSSKNLEQCLWILSIWGANPAPESASGTNMDRPQ